MANRDGNAYIIERNDVILDVDRCPRPRACWRYCQ